MPSFILRNLDPDFWARVRAKAAAEGIQVRALILRLLTDWLGMLLLAGLVTSCSEMQPSPVAPSATSPAGPSTTAPSTAQQPTYRVSLSDNGGTATVGQPWTSTLAVDSSVPSTPPASVSVNCGDGSGTQSFPGFVGLRIVGCTFRAQGQYTVTASVIAPNTVTTSTSATITAAPAPTPPPQLPPLALSAVRISGSANSVEWRFTVSSTDTLSNISWNFGDGAGSASNHSTEQHVYSKEGKYTVAVFATTSAHGDASTSREITATFDH